MGPSVRVFILAMVVTTMVARANGQDDDHDHNHDDDCLNTSDPQLTPAEQYKIMNESGCLPDDFNPPNFSECSNNTDLIQRLRCIADSTGIASHSGYNKTAAEAFIDQLSTSEEWRAQQKKHLKRCWKVMPFTNQLTVENQGRFALYCLHTMAMANCNKKRLKALAKVADAEKGKEIAKAIATFAEGWCLKENITWPGNAGAQWIGCAFQNGVNFTVMKDARCYYYKLAMGMEDLPGLTAETITAVDADLKKRDDISECYALASKEMNSNGTIDYDKISERTYHAVADPEVKAAIEKIFELCRSKNLEIYEDFERCLSRLGADACAVIKSFGLVSQ